MNRFPLLGFKALPSRSLSQGKLFTTASLKSRLSAPPSSYIKFSIRTFTSKPSINKDNFKFKSLNFFRGFRQSSRSQYEQIIINRLLLSGGIALGGSVVSYFLLPKLFSFGPLTYFKKNPTHLVYAIAGVNVAIFFLWRSASPFLYKSIKYLVLEPVNSSTFNFGQLLGAAFSHKDGVHLLCNMLCITSFGTTVASVFGPATFLTVYLSSALFSSFFSLLLPRLFALGAHASIGASGAAFGIMGIFSWFFPNATISLFFFPVPGGAWVAFLGSLVVNTAGLFMKWGPIDYAGHLGGSIAGLFLSWWYNKAYRNNRGRVIYK